MAMATSSTKVDCEVSVDPFYSRENMAELEKRVKDAKSGKNMHERNLIEVLDKTDEYAESNTERMSHEAVFGRLRRRINAIMTITEADEYDMMKTANALTQDLKRAEERADNEGWIDADEFDKEMRIIE